MSVQISDYEDYINYMRSKNPKSKSVMAWDKELKEAKAYALWHFKNVADEDFALMSNLELINWYRGLRKVA